MKLLNTDLYTLLINNISEGPGYVEGLLDKISESKMQSYSNLLDRYIGYMEMLTARNSKTKKGKIWVVYFLLGYISNQTAKICIEDETRVDLLKKSFVWYKAFLSTGKGNEDTRYYAGWQSGVIQQTIGFSWPVVEGTYLETVKLDIHRGEAMKCVLDHYYTSHEWRTAHIYSSYCMKNFLGRNPRSDHRWQIEPSFYNWEILNYHIPICLALRKKQEAKESLEKLLEYINHSPSDISADEVVRIRQYPESFSFS